MDILKLTLFTLLAVVALLACDYIGDSLTSTTDVTVNVGSGASTGSVVTTITPRLTVTPTSTPTQEAATVVTPRIF